MNELTIKREIESLELIVKLIEKFVIQHKLDNQTSYLLNLSAEELFTNMVKYSREGTGDINIILSFDKNKVMMKFKDHGVDEFDITKAREPDFDASLEDKRIGGLGIHLVKEMMDKVEYEYKDRTSIITVFKNVEK